MLAVTDLSCERDQRLLFDHLSFSVQAGELLQIKGTNGAGKTTLLRILCGLYGEFEGEIDWQLEKFPLYLGHKPGVKDLLTAMENLRWLCQLHDTTASDVEISEVLIEVGLGGYEDIPCGNMSEGQRKRVNLARFYLLDSPAWLLDEPFSAIDTEGVKKFESLMSDHVAKGGSILFTSHQPIAVETEIRSLDLSAGKP